MVSAEVKDKQFFGNAANKVSFYTLANEAGYAILTVQFYELILKGLRLCSGK